ncbi:hypothetical protein [Verrucosispora sp. TAA-831]|uniref:hypothetical protein n=1 Tax=Verrucosispora sp. TAA-831 TaxID=3422227 RepID=UPI003D6EAC45
MGEQPQESVSGAGQPHEPRLGPERARPGADGDGLARDEPDVLLDVPRVSVDSIRLSVDGLDADLSLRARVAGLVEIDAGARVRLEGVDLDITGAQAQALLKVRLEKLVTILDRALTTIDHNPQVIDAPGRANGAERRPAVQAGPTGQPGPQARDPRGEHPGHPASGARPRPADRPVGATSVGQVADRRGGSPTGRGAGPEGQAVGRTADRPGDAPEPGIGPPGGATDELGQQVGAIGAVADRAPGGAGAGQDGPPARDRAAQEPETGTATSSGPEPSAARQLAEQTGESILHAGRSVWDAIQSGLAQRRQDG